MVPGIYVLIDKIPLSANGKVDRNSLPDPDSGNLAASTDFVEPRTELEELLVNIWKDVVGIDRIGIHDNFFDLGGHSLLVTQVVSRIRDALDIELPVRAVFESPTVAELAVAVVQAQAQQTDADMLEEMLAELEQLQELEVKTLVAGSEFQTGGGLNE
jgi:acyl carrier protein